MIQGKCPPNFAPPRMNCGPDPRMTNARAAAVACAGIRSGQCVDLFEQAEVIIEPAVVTAPNVFNHHRRVEHIVPVITEDIHRHHQHHEFVARPEPRMRQTFDSDISIGRPLPAPQFVQAPVVQQQQFVQPQAMQQQLVPFEIDVIEKFGVAPQAQMTNWNGGMAQQVQAVPFAGFGNQVF